MKLVQTLSGHQQVTRCECIPFPFPFQKLCFPVIDDDEEVVQSFFIMQLYHLSMFIMLSRKLTAAPLYLGSENPVINIDGFPNDLFADGSFSIPTDGTNGLSNTGHQSLKLPNSNEVARVNPDSDFSSHALTGTMDTTQTFPISPSDTTYLADMDFSSLTAYLCLDVDKYIGYTTSEF